ncbi:MAG: hypothetical protein RL376_366 [Verrucomicrobiota bacterium]|jgi:galactosylceramidase
MPYSRLRLAASTLLASLLGAAALAAPAPIPIDLASAPPGSVFEGIGALSAGASSRLLPDYPEPQRSQILDLLFAPKLGAALQHFKVEIGGEVNSTCGTEPSHRRTRDEAPDYTRGYEWWLMKEARRRNPAIPLDTLCWGAPAWIGGGTYYSQDMADYVADFLAGAKQHHGLDIGYTGIWNERAYDIPWIKLLRKTLDARGLSAVEIIAADACVNQWAIAKDAARDPELQAAISLLGEHYPAYASTPEAKASGKRLWAAEDGPWRGDWTGARQLARVYNRNYITGGMTKTVIWSLITSYYDNLPLPGSGLMTANTPWSGAFTLDPALWATAHTTQFSAPGWTYLGGDASRLLPGGSVVSLVSPDHQDLTLIVETMDADEPTTLEITVPPALATRTFFPWLSRENEYFIPQTGITPAAGRLSLTVPPKTLLTISTTTGQKTVRPTSPSVAPFPSPYHDDFTHTRPGALGRFLSDQGGVFEVVAEPDGNHLLRQQVARKGIEWQPTPEPETFLGEPTWEEQSLRVRARLEPVTPEVRPEAARYLAVYARVGFLAQNAAPAPGYGLRVYESGRWELRDAARVLAEGVVPPLGETWHTLGIRASGPHIEASLDDRTLAKVSDRARPRGQVGLGSGYHPAAFDDLAITGHTPTDLALGASATASSVWDESHGAERAVDGLAADGLKGPTRWNSGKTVLPEEWLELAFKQPQTCNTARIIPFENRISAWRLEAWLDSTWKTVARGEANDGQPREFTFPTITTTQLRFVAEAPRQSISLYDFQVFLREIK